eukprot:TRINITY_DN4977_c2_g1_i1.p1 TRINITY_DN4977_c2_g1~~TRINITY_DN4977_c2_g1_i1.p1  ORF type:complete len:201 (+),score=-6.76 TRINITY_DN4977_c2_g1_i1:99-701(+)
MGYQLCELHCSEFREQIQQFIYKVVATQLLYQNKLSVSHKTTSQQKFLCSYSTYQPKISFGRFQEKLHSNLLMNYVEFFTISSVHVTWKISSIFNSLCTHCHFQIPKKKKSNFKNVNFRNNLKQGDFVIFVISQQNFQYSSLIICVKFWCARLAYIIFKLVNYVNNILDKTYIYIQQIQFIKFHPAQSVTELVRRSRDIQ